MLLIKNSRDLSNTILKIRSEGKKINFIPTMGNLHDGHLSLISNAKGNKNINLVSIFVNPLQFNDKDDFNRYPRTLKSDKLLLEKSNVDILYVTNADFISKNILTLCLGYISKKLCGRDRKGHFEGVGTVILKLLVLINPDFIFLGEKDFQQVLIIKKIIDDFHFRTKVEVLPTIRDKNNVALSSRNQLIKRNFSLLDIIPKTLIQISNEIEEGSFLFSRISYLKKLINKKGIDRVNYLEILKEKDLSNLDYEYSICRIFISVTINHVRLIDNISIKRKIRLCYKKKLIEISS